MDDGDDFGFGGGIGGSGGGSLLPAEAVVDLAAMYAVQMEAPERANPPHTLGGDVPLVDMRGSSGGGGATAVLDVSPAGATHGGIDDGDGDGDGGGGGVGGGVGSDSERSDVAQGDAGDVDLSYRALGGSPGGVDAVCERGADGVTATRMFGAFLRGFGSLEAGYAQGLMELAERASAAVAKVRSETRLGNSSLLVAWDGLIKVLEQKAATAGGVAGQLRASVADTSKTAEELRVRHAEIARDLRAMQKERRELGKEVAAAEKAYAAAMAKAKAAEIAAGPDAPRLEETQPKLTARVHRAEEKYESALRWAHGARQIHDAERVPDLLARFQAADEARTSALKSTLVSLVAVLNAPNEAYANVTSRLACRVAVIDPEADCETFVERTLHTL